MVVPKFKGKVNNNRFVPENMDGFKKWMESLNEKKVELVVQKEKRSKTSKQLAYYWSVAVRIISQETGDDPDSTHAFLKSMFLKSYKVVKNKRYTVVGSVRKLTTVRMNEYVEKCRRWGAQELNLNIPEPNSVQLDEEVEI
jgi:hypothetical protein